MAHYDGYTSSEMIANYVEFANIPAEMKEDRMLIKNFFFHFCNNVDAYDRTALCTADMEKEYHIFPCDHIVKARYEDMRNDPTYNKWLKYVLLSRRN